MQIATLVYSLEGIGGIAKHVLYLCSELAQMGHDIDIWAVEYDEARCYPELSRSLNVRALRQPGRVPFETSSTLPGSRMAAYLAGLRQYYNDQRELAALIPEGYDVINPHGNGIHWAAAAYRRQHGTPAVWLCNDFWPMTIHKAANDDSLIGKMKSHFKQSLSAPFDRIDRASTHWMDKIAVLSERVQSQMRQHYGVESVVIRPGVTRPDGSVGRAALRARLGIPDDTFLLLTICMLMPRRRLEDAIYAVRRLVDQGHKVRYVIAGNTTHTPSYTEFIQNEIEAQGLHEHVNLIGEVPEHELGSYYDACDAFVWPADENQSWGLASMEAMLWERPVLVSQANGLAEVLQDGIHALLFPPRAPDALADCLQQLLNDSQRGATIARQGQRFVQNHYSWRSNADAMIDLFNRAIAPAHEQGLRSTSEYVPVAE
jgi:glycosyltransferase involved in cell wall biosynthesis